MSNADGSSGNSATISKLEMMRKNLDDELKAVNHAVEQVSASSNEKSRLLFEKLLADITQKATSLQEALEQSINSNQTSNLQELKNLQESLNGQLSSLRSFADKLVHDEESRIVGTLEQSLEEMNQLNSDSSAKFKELINSLTIAVDTTTNSPIKYVESQNGLLKADLVNVLELEGDKLSKSMSQLQNEFRDKIGEQIEKVFMGVTMTKETLNGIIRDTLSRLEVNLSRLNSGIDDNFTKEIGVTQDLIHKYEGKMMEAILNSKTDYENAMNGVVNRNSDALEKSMTTLKSELEKTKNQLNADLQGLTKQQQQLLDNALKAFESQIDKSKAEVIESHGLLKDDLETLLNKNTESINEFMNIMKTNSTNNVAAMVDLIKERTSNIQEVSSMSIKSGKKEVESLLEQLKKDNSQRIDQASKKVNVEFDSLNTEGN